MNQHLADRDSPSLLYADFKGVSMNILSTGGNSEIGSTYVINVIHISLIPLAFISSYLHIVYSGGWSLLLLTGTDMVPSNA